MTYSLMTLSFFRSCGLRRKYHAKSLCVYTCFDTCHPVPDNLANKDSLPDNEDIALASMKSRDKRVTTKDAAPSSNTVAAAALGSTFNSLLRVLGRVYGFWVPCSGPERALKPSPGFCVVDLSLRVEPRWMLGPRVSIMGRSLLSLQMVLRNQRPVLTPWNQLLQLLPFLGKWFCRTQMTWWMIPPPSPYLIKA